MTAINGPWRVIDTPDRAFVLVDRTGQFRGVLHDLDSATLAGAAPDLLAAASAVLAYLERLETDVHTPQGAAPASPTLLPALRAALRQATDPPC